MSVIYGTERIINTSLTDLIYHSYDLGYRKFDTAQAYNNLTLLGKAFKRLQKRETIQISSKISKPYIEKYSFNVCFEMILRELKVDYLDYLFIHAPKGINHYSIFLKMLKLKDQKKIINCGLSNYTIKHLEKLKANYILPDTLQVEVHPYLNEHKLVEYCHTNKIELMAHSAFAHGKVFQDKKLLHIARNNHCSISQLVLSWAIHRKYLPIISTLNKEHLKNNIESKSISLKDETIKLVDELNFNNRICFGEEWAEFD
jgi:2,5-diketo-D-gluconate reductase B